MTCEESAPEVLPISSTESDCSTCRQLRLEGLGASTFRVAPADGGGWHAWSAALLRLFARMGSGPTRAVIISQPIVNDRYVQAQVGHGIAHAEVGSNVYLPEDSRLSADHESLLAALGWLPPRSDTDDPDEMPANWYLPLINGDWAYLTEMFMAVMIGFLGFDERFEVVISSFQCANPCRACSWPADISPSAAT